MRIDPSVSAALKDVEVLMTYRCPVRWEAMEPVAERVRHCARCDHRVYDLRDRSEAEIRALIAAHDGELCGYASVRPDGTVVAGACAPTQLRGRIVAR
ncbi:MAG: hypothetical protein H6739_30230 [Alphaproteobacteria bacterium]|nr:hypothetical protein [Alphaproteobacteria bacterium]